MIRHHQRSTGCHTFQIPHESVSRQSDARTSLRRNGCSSGSHTKKRQMPQGLQKEDEPPPGRTHLHTHPQPGGRNDTYESCGKIGNTRTIPSPQNSKECKCTREHSTFTQSGAMAPFEAMGPRPPPTNLTTNSKTDL